MSSQARVMHMPSGLEEPVGHSTREGPQEDRGAEDVASCEGWEGPGWVRDGR